MNDCSPSRRYRIKLLQDRCKIIVSGSLHSANLGHDNSCNEMLWILEGYIGSKSDNHSGKKEVLMPIKCSDPICEPGRTLQGDIPWCRPSEHAPFLTGPVLMGKGTVARRHPSVLPQDRLPLSAKILTRHSRISSQQSKS